MKAEETKLELEGHVYLTDYDKDGNIVGKEEIDGEMFLQCVALIMGSAIKNMTKEKMEEIKERFKNESETA